MPLTYDCRSIAGQPWTWRAALDPGRGDDCQTPHMLSLRTQWLTPDSGRDLLVVGPSLGTGVVALWQDCARELERLADVDVLAWDLPGHGDGGPEHEPFTLEELAEAVVRAVEAARPGVGIDWTHAGVSVGGATGLHLALRGAVRGSAVICSGPKLGTPQAWTERAETVRRNGTEVIVDGSRERWFAPGFADHEPGVAERLLQTLRAADAESYAQACGALALHDVRERLREITVPVLALGGVDDQVAPPEMQQSMADAIPGGTVAILDRVAHLAPAEAPIATAEELAVWLP